MASAKDLRKRISSVKNTQQITKAMKMVAASKLRRAQEAITSIRPYAGRMRSVVAGLMAGNDDAIHPLLDAARVERAEKVLLIVVTSDRGLCGGFNANVIRATQRYIRTNAHKYKKLDVGFIGKKGYDFLRGKVASQGRYYQNFFAGLKYSKSQVLAEELIAQYLAGEYDTIKFVYNEFKSAISQKVVIETYLPVRLDSDEQRSSAEAELPVIYEPSSREILDKLLPRYFATQVHRILLESLASEHGARMSAMENATKNAGEMLHKLTLEYNKSRQAAITKELLEITAGAEAAQSA
jgi:F-type H+-transporting ATPase subunit gamma